MKATLKDLKLDPKNANKHSQFGTGLLENSIRENGFGRSILISNDNVVIAGNGVAEGGGSVGMEDVEIVPSDGKKIIAVKRTDIMSGTAEFYKMALSDNIVAQKNIVLDAEVVEAIVQEYPEARVWGAIVTDEEERIVDKDQAGQVEVKFSMTGQQASKLKKALKIAKQKMKTGEKSNTAALMFIATWFNKQKM